MHSITANIFLGWFIVLVASRPGAEEPRALLDRAIQAHGGKERIERTKIGRIKGTVKGSFGAGGTLDAAFEEVFDLPERYHRTVEGQFSGRSIRWEAGVNGVAGWTRQRDEAPQSFPVSGPIPLNNYWYTALLQLVALRGKENTLTPLDDERKGGRAFAGIRAASPQGTADLYFDKSTNLLAHARQALPNIMPGRETVGEVSYDDYHPISGVRYPMHAHFSDGDRLSLDYKLTSVEFLDKIDASAFARPKVAQPTPNPPGEDAASGGGDAGGTGVETPARWDVRLIAATLGVGAIIGAVWLFVRASRRRGQQTPQV